MLLYSWTLFKYTYLWEDGSDFGRLCTLSLIAALRELMVTDVNVDKLSLLSKHNPNFTLLVTRVMMNKWDIIGYTGFGYNRFRL
jgi:hypothetical protein